MNLGISLDQIKSHHCRGRVYFRMSATSGFLTEEQRKLMRSASHGRDAAMPEDQRKFVRSVSHGQHPAPDVSGSGLLADHGSKHAAPAAKLVSVGSGEVKKERHSHSGKNGRPKKGG